jgi:uncharacterized oligopeptide transporter (OPT) family protein
VVLGERNEAVEYTTHYPSISKQRIKNVHRVQLTLFVKGFILGEGFLSIVNLVLQGLQVPHF